MPSRAKLSLSGSLLLLVLSPFAIATGLLPARAATDISGIWLGQERDGHVEIKACGTFLCGNVISILDPKLPPNPRDFYNQKPELRSRPICQLEVLGNLKDTGDAWEGWVYDPRRGKSFNVDVKLKNPNTLMVHGYLGMKLLGETKEWTRANNSIRRCTRPGN